MCVTVCRVRQSSSRRRTRSVGLQDPNRRILYRETSREQLCVAQGVCARVGHCDRHESTKTQKIKGIQPGGATRRGGGVSSLQPGHWRGVRASRAPARRSSRRDWQGFRTGIVWTGGEVDLVGIAAVSRKRRRDDLSRSASAEDETSSASA